MLGGLAATAKDARNRVTRQRIGMVQRRVVNGNSLWIGQSKGWQKGHVVEVILEEGNESSPPCLSQYHGMQEARFILGFQHP
jgi:hypothetical protein